MSFHGIPRRSLDLGDPYHCECHRTGRLLAEALELAPAQYRVSFQSRFGRAEWLKPYTVATLEELGQTKTGRVDVICPGFIADCLETLEEIAMEGKEIFQEAGGKDYRYIPALNDQPSGSMRWRIWHSARWAAGWTRLTRIEPVASGKYPAATRQRDGC
jgi:ferrochelatase